ncbi:MAG: hypothetical protein C3F02_03030 [Parcubacteria group bacterium]|nr:MAG: hypothetical protein C3F02_03030 [Parcubacteria group bacterium]
MSGIKEYTKYLKAGGLKKQTVENYLWHTSKFLNWLGTNDLNTEKIKSYQKDLVRSAYSPATVNLHLISINKYLDYRGLKSKLHLVAEPTKELDYLNKRQLSLFVEAVPNTSKFIHLRDRALLEILYTTGLKVGQIILLKKHHIDTVKQEIILDNKKQLLLPPLAWSALKKYLDRRVDDIDYLFVNLDRAQKGKEMMLSIRSVERIIEKYGRQIGLEVTPQILRNTLAKNLKNDGADRGQLQAQLHFHTKLGAENYLKRI